MFPGWRLSNGRICSELIGRGDDGPVILQQCNGDSGILVPIKTKSYM